MFSIFLNFKAAYYISFQLFPLLLSTQYHWSFCFLILLLLFDRLLLLLNWLLSGDLCCVWVLAICIFLCSLVRCILLQLLVFFCLFPDDLCLALCLTKLLPPYRLWWVAHHQSIEGSPLFLTYLYFPFNVFADLIH